MLAFIINLSSCNISNKIGNPLTSEILLQADGAKFTVDACQAIYQINELSPGTPVYIHKFRVQLNNDATHYLVDLDSLRFVFINDSIYFDDLELPFKRQLWPDSVSVLATCKYSHDSVFTDLKCITRPYTIRNGELKPIQDFGQCGD